jgi:hypothetical protein
MTKKKHNHQHVLKQRDPQAGACPGIVLLAECFERHHRHRRRAEAHCHAEHDAVCDGKSQGASYQPDQRRGDAHLQAATDQGGAPEVLELAERKLDAQREHQ